MNCPRVFAPSFVALICWLLVAAPVWAGDDWKPVDPAHRALKAPMVEKDADAEVIFWEVYVDDAGEDTVLRHYIRSKIFTERGVESQGKVDISYLGKNNIKDIAGRTIKADGTIIELKKDAIFERTIVKVGGFKIKTKSFALPGVEPGAIIEYRWREIRTNQSANYVRLQFQRSIPVQSVKYYLKPSPAILGGMHALTFHGKNAPFVKEKNGFYSTEMTSMPAFHEEPRMPPEDQVRTWMLVYYAREEKIDPQKFWQNLGKRLYEELKSNIKVNDDIRRAAAEAIGDATTPEQKLQRLLEFCRTKIKNISSDTSDLTREERAKLKDNKSPADTLKRGYGTNSNIDFLFAALATAAGFEARLALLPDRSDIFFDPSFPNIYFMRHGEIAVRIGEAWRFFDPSETYVPYGMLPWRQEGVQALVTDPKEPTFVQTPLSPAEKSLQKRTAKLKLSEDGALEGEVRIEYTGHFAIEKRNYKGDESAQERENTLRETVKAQMSTAELDDIKIENVTDTAKPLVYTYRVSVPGYAQRTGKRLFLQPGFFQHGLGALFQTSQRRHPVYFHYPWAEEDTLTIDLPAGFSLDNAERPQPISAGQISQCDIRIAITQDGSTLHYKRTFHFGGTGTILFPTESYAQLKKLFDAYHQLDNHTITLKQGAAASGGEK